MPLNVKVSPGAPEQPFCRSVISTEVAWMSFAVQLSGDPKACWRHSSARAGDAAASAAVASISAAVRIKRALRDKFVYETGFILLTSTRPRMTGHRASLRFHPQAAPPCVATIRCFPMRSGAPSCPA
jgi:hypothetical protein